MRLVDVNDQLCDTLAAPSCVTGAIVFTDDNHLTASFSRSIAPALGRRIAEAMGD